MSTDKTENASPSDLTTSNVASTPLSPHSRRALPQDVLSAIFTYISIEIEPVLSDHYCNMRSPCVSAMRKVPYTVDFMKLVLVCRAWKEAFPLYPEGKKWTFCGVEKLITHWGRTVHFGSAVLDKTIEWNGSYKGVYYGYNLGTPLNCETKIPVVIKATNKNSRDTKAEDHAYDKLPTETPLIGYPRLYSSGWQNYSVRYLILEKLGPTLQAVLDRTPEKKLGDEKMILAVAIQVIKRYRDLHARGILHNGCKPANFCISPNPSEPIGPTSVDPHILYIIDFDVSEKDDTELERYHVSSGNPVFSSLSYHLQITRSYKDDLECLAYLLAFLYKGQLPWSRGHEEWKVIMETPSAKLFEGMDPVFPAFLDKVKALAWGEIPNYAGMIAKFAECWVRKDYGDCVGQFNWWNHYNSLSPDQRKPIPPRKMSDYVEPHAIPLPPSPPGSVNSETLPPLRPSPIADISNLLPLPPSPPTMIDAFPSVEPVSANVSGAAESASSLRIQPVPVPVPEASESLPPLPPSTPASGEDSPITKPEDMPLPPSPMDNRCHACMADEI